MANKESNDVKAVSINQTKKFIKYFNGNSACEVKIPFGDEEFVVLVKPYLTYSEFEEFVRFVTDACFSFDKIKGAYSDYEAYCKQFAIALYTLKYYTNIRIPEDATSFYPLIEETPIMDQVLSAINKRQYHQLKCAIDEKIELRKQLVIHDKKYSDLDDKISELKDALLYLGEIMGSPEDAQRALSAFANMGNITGDSIVQAMHERGIIGESPEKDTTLKVVK